MEPAKVVLKTGRSNKFDRWLGGERSAAARFAQRVVIPKAEKTFSIKEGSVFFAIGSCFARNVEERLALAGANVKSLDFDASLMGSKSARPGGVFNKYNPLTILQEVEWAAGERGFPENGFLEVEEGVFYDPYLRINAERGSEKYLWKRRQAVKEYFQEVFSADVVIFTLGLTEAWFDKETGFYLNEVPDPKSLNRNSDRFYFKNLTVKDVREALVRLHSLLKKHSKSGQRIILTVSPVPLGRTFNTDDIIVANTTSKSTLRVAAMSLAKTRGNVNYFPSYEAVTSSDPRLAWDNDRLHVSDFIVGHVIGEFLNTYGLAKGKAEAVAATIDGQSEKASAESDPMFAMKQESDAYKAKIIRLERELRELKQLNSARAT